jgi:hypothetical protein
LQISIARFSVNRQPIGLRQAQAFKRAKPAEGLSRRLMLAGLAVVGIPTTLPATAEPEPDLIFAAIELHR